MEKAKRKSSNATEMGPYSISKTGGPCSVYRKSTKIQSSTFNLDERYEIIEVLGQGAYGVVVSVNDSVTGEKLAVKKIEKAFDHPTFTKRTLRELKIMRLMNHENVLTMKAIQLPKSRAEFEDIYVVMELLETDLSSIIKSPQPLSDDHVQFFLYQILRGMKYMHSAKLLHRDLKPRNLLVNSNCDLKICDFGLARADLPNLTVRAAQMTDYVATRWYRAPEVLLAVKHYTSAMDMWSIGCIFAELLLRKPILPGKDTQDQIQLIFNLIGPPSQAEIEKIPNARARRKVMDMPLRQGRTFDQLFRDQNPESVELLKRMLEFDPNSRISVDEALEHPYLAALHYPEDEPNREPVPRYDFDFERQLLSAKDLKDLIYEDILLHHFPDKVSEYDAAVAEMANRAPGPREEAKGENSGESDDEMG